MTEELSVLLVAGAASILLFWVEGRRTFMATASGRSPGAPPK